MRLVGEIKNKCLYAMVDLPDGKYTVDIKENDLSKTWEQCKKLWATINDISKHEFGTTIEAESIYFQILEMAGIDTDYLIVRAKTIPLLKTKVKTLSVVSREGKLNDPEAECVVRVCFKGLSTMTRKEASKVIECCIDYACQCGIVPQVERIL